MTSAALIAAPGLSRRAVLVAAVSTLCFAAWVVVFPGHASVARWGDDTATAAAALVATACCAVAAARHGRRGRMFWLLLGAACAAWSFGEITWGAYDLATRGDVPLPGLPDAGYLAAVPLACAALLCHPSARDRFLLHGRVTLDSLSAAAALFFLSWTLVLGPLWSSASMSDAAGLVMFSYPVTDTLVVALVVVALRRADPGERAVLLGVLAGLSVMALTDLGWAYLTEVHDYATGNIIDTGWFAAYALLAVAAVSARPPERWARREEPAEATRAATMILPLVPVLLALAVSTVQTARGDRLDAVSWWTVVLLVVLVILRQVLMVVDNLPLIRSLARTGVVRP